MSQMPPPPGESSSPPPPPSGPNPADMINGPAIALMVTAILGLVVAGLSILLNLLGVSIGAAEGGEQGVRSMITGGMGIVSAIIGAVVGVVVLIGSIKMRKLESWGFALTASIRAMIPRVSPCCLLGLPFGIWALVVLVKPEVKETFQS